MKKFHIDQNMRSELLNLYKVLSPYPETKNTLEQLKNKNYKIAILSNGTPSLLNGLIEKNNMKIFFDDIFSIEEVGIFKPSSKVYEIPIKKYKIDKREVAFLSSNTWDVCGGGNFGYNSIWVNRNKNIFDKLDYKPKHVIRDLEELLSIF
tara:strand:- start:572 stop:1021 length:450 start_codon:yes stop_codon:yes gene_type:complete